MTTLSKISETLKNDKKEEKPENKILNKFTK